MAMNIKPKKKSVFLTDKLNEDPTLKTKVQKMSRNVSNTESQETIDPCGYRVRVRVAIEGRHTESSSRQQYSISLRGAEKNKFSFFKEFCNFLICFSIFAVYLLIMFGLHMLVTENTIYESLCELQLLLFNHEKSTETGTCKTHL